jgi:Na+-transporting NADH:ubiquinone oxidoreductase subunit NqrD
MMRFRFELASGDETGDQYLKGLTKEVVTTELSMNRVKKSIAYVIELNTLESLVTLMKQYNKDFVIGIDKYCSVPLSIIVYDDYLE